MIRLKFIGADGSMGLSHGKTYNVAIRTDNKYIWVIVQTGLSHWKCPYSSPQALANNWSI